jgi:hypothetical protein
MVIKFCTHCGYKDDDFRYCPKCGNFNIRTLSGERHCIDCLDLIEIRDKDDVSTNSFTCRTRDFLCSYWLPVCPDFRDKLKAIIPKDE